MRTGLAPQLTLEAAMLRQGGFNGGNADRRAVGGAGLCALKGGARAGEFMPIDFKEGTPDAQADRALEKLAELVDALRRRARALSLAGPSDVESALWRL